MKVPIPVGARLTFEKCPKKQEEIEDMARVPYASVDGSLMYAMVCTRPDIAHAVGVLRRYMSTPGKDHLVVVKRVLWYFCGTNNYAIHYQGKPRGGSGKLDVHGIVDAD
jgi:hypothetical protein